VYWHRYGVDKKWIKAQKTQLLWNSWTHFRQSYRLEQYVSNECITRFGASLYTKRLHHETQWNDVAVRHDKICSMTD
jgi:hypothetical protein